jgi:hypothetical protein
MEVPVRPPEFACTASSFCTVLSTGGAHTEGVEGAVEAPVMIGSMRFADRSLQQHIERLT